MIYRAHGHRRPRRHGVPTDQRARVVSARGSSTPVFLAMAIILSVGAVGVAVGFVVLNLWANRPRPPLAQARLEAVVSPSAGGADVTVTVEPTDATTLPTALTLVLPDADDGVLMPPSARTTSGTMRYTGLRLGERPVIASRVSFTVQVKATPTDPHRLVFRYHMDDVAGRRVVFLPALLGLDVRTYTYSAAPQVDCEMTDRVRMGRPYYTPCAPGGGRIDIGGHDRLPIRLELTE
jgi:hypothetical protein